MNQSCTESVTLVAYAPEHADGVVAVVRAVHDEYGFSWEADGYHADLYDIERHYLARGGAFFVLLDGRRVIGTVGVTPHDADECELHRMYLLAAYRGRGMGRRMLDTALNWARQRGCRRMIAWSDVKLTTAHALYESYGFVRFGQRICDDPDKSREHGFAREPL